MNKFFLSLTFIFSFSAVASAEVFIISPKNGEKVSSPVEVIFGLKGMLSLIHI